MKRYKNYKFYYNNKTIYAVSSYAGRTVKGISTCADDDKYDEEYGKELAVARCDVRVASKRMKRASSKVCEARAQMEKANQYLNRMLAYAADTRNEYAEAVTHLEQVLDKSDT